MADGGAAKAQTKRQPEVGGLKPETGDRLHGNQLIKDSRSEAETARGVAEGNVRR